MATIFIGSSTEQREVAEQVALAIEAADCTARPWWDLAKPGQFFLKSLVEEAHGVDAALFVISPDDKTWYRNNEYQSPRDNVVFEYGLFLGRHGLSDPSRAVVLRLGVAKLPSDVDGIVYMPFSPAKPATFRSSVMKWAKEVRATVAAKATTQALPKFSVTKKELFEAGSQLISLAKERVSLCAKTPVVVVGPRPYDGKSTPVSYEKVQFDTYMKLADLASRGKLAVTFISSLPAIRKDMAAVNDSQFKMRIKKNVEQLFGLASKKDSQLRLCWYDGMSPCTFVVSDNQALLWWKGTNQDTVMIKQSSDDFASTLCGHHDGAVKQLGKLAVLRELGLER